MTSFLYTVDPEADEPIMLIDRHIGLDAEDGFGIMGDLFQRELLSLDGMGKKRIQVWINSVGGIVTDGYNIYNAILKTKTKVDTYCTGIAASIAAVIFQAGRIRYMADYGKLMYHNPYGGNDDKQLEMMKDSLATMVATRCDKTVDDIKAIMKKTTWIGADEALENGFCDEVHDSGDANKKRVLKTADQIKNFWKESNDNTQKKFKNKNSHIMSKVANKLNLNAEASEDAMVQSIDTLQNKLKDVEVKNKTSNEELDALKAEVAKKQGELDKMKAELDGMHAKAKKEKEDAEAKAKADAEESDKKKAEAAKNMITAFVAEGRIKNDEATITKWTAMAKSDPDGLKAMIEGLPVSAKAAKIVTSGNTSGEKKNPLTSVVANKMAKLLSEGK